MPPLEVLQGTLDLLILKTLSWGPAHGYAVARWIEQLTAEVLQVGRDRSTRRFIAWKSAAGSNRSGATRRTTAGRSSTARGRQQLRAESASWARFVEAVARVLGATAQPE